MNQAFPFQLTLPSLESIAAPPPPGIPRPRRVFCNRQLRMSGVSWVGFDMDYTLAIYDQLAMDEISIKATIDKLKSDVEAWERAVPAGATTTVFSPPAKAGK